MPGVPAFLFRTSAALLAVSFLAGQVPLERLSPVDRAAAEDIIRRADFAFQTRTTPKRVKLATMDQLFDHPKLGAAMWRSCGFAPTFFAFVYPNGSWSIDDGRGLRGTLTLAYRQPGLRVYLVEGRADAGRLKTPFAVSARMVTVYRYWQSPRGFETDLQTWTALDSAILGVMSRPFRPYIRGRQDEFIAYINGNLAIFGEFAQSNPYEFREPLRREGDPQAIRDFERLFPGK